jgi:hypothetical protein
MKVSKVQKKLNGFLIVFLVLMVAFSHATNVGAAPVEVRIGNMTFTKKVKSVNDMKFDNMVRQTKDYSCGAAALATVLTHYFGRETSEEEILGAILNNSDQETVERVRKIGLSLLDLKNFAESLGFEGKGYKLSPEQLKTLDRPAIALISYKGYNHFVVIKGASDEKVFLADPAKGNKVKSLNEFLNMWNGILLAFRNSNSEKIQSHALYAKSGLPENKIDLLPNLFDIGFATNASEF